LFHAVVGLLRSGRKDGAIVVVAAEDGADVAFGGWEIDLGEEGGAVGGGGAALPFEDVAATSVVIGQRVGERAVGVGVALEESFEIPCAGKGVRGGIKEGFGREQGEMLGFGPIGGGGGGDDLHEADFAARTAGAGVEAAFAPDDGFDERGVNGVTARGGEDGRVLAVVAPLIPPPITAACGQKQEQRDGDGKQAFHGDFLAGKSVMTKGIGRNGAGAIAQRKSEGGFVQEERARATGCILPFRPAGRLCYPFKAPGMRWFNESA
jgi:hypothetical protein